MVQTPSVRNARVRSYRWYEGAGCQAHREILKFLRPRGGNGKGCLELRSRRMGEMIEFQSNGSTAGGYLAVPESGSGPGVVVIQEWWGLVDHIKDVCDRFAAAGFAALAPDLYHGQKVAPGEPDEAGKAMMAMKMDAGGSGHERCGRRAVAAELGRQGRGHRILHGRRARARAGDPASRRGGGGGPVLRRHPVARRAAGLLGDVGGGARPLRGEGRLLHARGRQRVGRAVARHGQVGRDRHLSRTRITRSSTTRGPRCTTKRRRARCGIARWRSSPSTCAERTAPARRRAAVGGARAVARRALQPVCYHQVMSARHATCPAAPASPPPVPTRSSWPRHRPSRPT